MKEKEKLVLPKKENLISALRIFRFVRPYKWQFIFGMVLLFLSSGVFMVFPYVVGKMLDTALNHDQASGYSLKVIGLILIAVLVVQGIVSYIRVIMFAQMSENASADIRKELYRKLISLPIVFYEKSRVGELVSRITNDVEKVYLLFYFVLAEFVRQLIILIGGVVVLAVQAPKLAGIMLATFPLIVVGAMILGRRIRRLSKSRQDELGASNTILDETLQTIHTVKAFTNEGFEQGRFSDSNNRVVKISMKFAAGRAVFAVFIITMLFGALFFVIWMGMNMVQSKEMEAGRLISFVIYTAIIGAAIAGLGNFYSELIGAIGATERIWEIFNMHSEGEERPAPQVVPARLKGDISFQHIKFSYPTRTDVTVLKDVSLDIKAGSKIALVGQSGAGKSTIMQLLLQFHRPDSGFITVDGIDIQKMELEAYRHNIAIVPQEVILFGGSIRENILYGKPEATEAELIQAARDANALDFIMGFPEGMETVVGERGIKLSGGQRQRIAIARALLRNPSILLLDEATSSLDAESEKVVQEALQRLMVGRTSVVIAHRLATIREVDCIYVLENGHIVEQGTHDELSMKSNGAYSALAKLQFEFA